MSSSQKYEANRNLRVELKYCEHCGGLWIREGGAGVYCVRCQPLVADLPAPKKKAGRAKLPVAPHTVVDEYEIEIPDDEAQDYEAAGGVA